MSRCRVDGERDVDDVDVEGVLQRRARWVLTVVGGKADVTRNRASWSLFRV